VEPQLPNLVIIGAQKCATSSLHRYLGAHPDVAMSKDKEVDFFVEEIRWPLGSDWYRSNFRADAKVRGESSPNYTVFPFYQGVPARMHSLIPDTKLIYVVRDPIERMLSQYTHNVDRHAETRSPEEALLNPDSGYLARSRYFMQLEQYLEYYDRSQILVLDYSALGNDTAATLRSVFAFLDVDAGFTSPLFETRFHGSGDKRRLTRAGAAARRLYRAARRVAPGASRLAAFRRSSLLSKKIERPVLSEQARTVLRERLSGDVRELRAFTGMAFVDWSL
jgi:hypothetical protein